MNVKIYLLLIVFLTTILSGPISAGDINNPKKISIFSVDLPVYKPPTNSDSKCRRIGGTAVTTQRGLTRGLGKSVSRRLAKALAKKSTIGYEEKGLAQKDTTPATERKLPQYLAPIAPEHVGFTANSQPVIYFYISSAWPDEVEFALTEEGVIKPVLKTRIQGPIKAGVLGINLRAHNLILKPNIEYEWFVSILPDPSDPLSKIFGSAVIKYSPPSPAFINTIQTTQRSKHQFIYAQKGYFYDSIDHLADLIETDATQSFRLQRAGLLDQVELPFIARYDRKI